MGCCAIGCSGLNIGCVVAGFHPAVCQAVVVEGKEVSGSYPHLCQRLASSLYLPPAMMTVGKMPEGPLPPHAGLGLEPLASCHTTIHRRAVWAVCAQAPNSELSLKRHLKHHVLHSHSWQGWRRVLEGGD